MKPNEEGAVRLHPSTGVLSKILRRWVKGLLPSQHSDTRGNLCQNGI